MNNKKYYPFILLLSTAIAVGCVKDQGADNDLLKNQYEIAEWSSVQENLVSKEKFFFELDEDVVFPSKGEYKFDSCKDNLISGTITAVLTPEGFVEGTEVESKIPRLLAVQIALDKISYSSSGSKISLNSKDDSTDINFIDLEWDVVDLKEATTTLVISGDMDQEAIMSNRDISCNITLFLKLSDGELIKFHFTELTPGTPPFSMN